MFVILYSVVVAVCCDCYLLFCGCDGLLWLLFYILWLLLFSCYFCYCLNYEDHLHNLSMLLLSVVIVGDNNTVRVLTRSLAKIVFQVMPGSVLLQAWQRSSTTDRIRAKTKTTARKRKGPSKQNKNIKRKAIDNKI